MIAEAFLLIPSVWLAVGGFLLGAIIGSFLGAIVVRWPKGESVVTGRSRCDGCARTLRGYELVPILSYFLAQGKCRACGARIDPVHLMMEIAAGIIAAISLTIYPDITGLCGTIFGWILLILAVLDVRHFWLPDRLTLLLLAFGIAIAASMETPMLTESLIGAVAGFGVLSLISFGYRAIRGRDGLGAGDPKLLAAIGAWLGWQILPLVLLLASVLGLCVAILHFACGKPVTATEPLPLGAMMAVVAWPLWLARDVVRAYFGL